MTRNTSASNKSGFSLIELGIVLAILSMLAGTITPVFIKRIQIRAGEKTALEMSIIQQAALSYFVDNNAWPASLAALQGAGYLDPSWLANNPWQSPYEISSTANSFTVSTAVPKEWLSLVARDLPTVSISETTVNSSVPIPGSVPDSSLPAGSIIMWSGAPISIPSGWQLCDGTNDTPDLRDRFVVGVGTKYQVGDKGGTDAHRLTIEEMPAHSHSSLRLAQKGVFAIPLNWGSHRVWPDGTTGVTGGNRPHENRPPYYAVCFIMKME